VERGDVALQAAIGGAHLQAELVSPHELGIEHRARDLGGAVGAAVEAAGLEATIGRDVSHDLLAELLLQRERRRPCTPAFAAAEGERAVDQRGRDLRRPEEDRKSTRLNSSHVKISYAVFCLKKKEC